MVGGNELRRYVFSELFLGEMNKVRLSLREELLGCFREEYAGEVRAFCEKTGYDVVNALAPIVFLFSFFNSRSRVVMRECGREEVSDLGCFSLFVVGPSASGKTGILSKILYEIYTWEREERRLEKDRLVLAAFRVERLLRQAREGGLSQEEALELKREQEYIVRYQPALLTYTTPERLLRVLDEKRMVALVDNEGESLVKNIFSRRSVYGLSFDGMVNNLLDGVPISYAIKSELLSLEVSGYTFGIYCNVQEEYLRQVESFVVDITNKLGRFDFVFITEDESKHIAHISKGIVGGFSMPKVRSLLQDVYRARVREGDYRGGNVGMDGGIFLGVYRDFLRFFSSMWDDRDAVVMRLIKSIQKHRARWGAYARGLAPLCRDEASLSKAVGIWASLMLMNAVRYHILPEVGGSVTGGRGGVDGYLKRCGVGLYDLIKNARERKVQGADGSVRVDDLRRAYMEGTGAKSRQAFYKFLRKLEDLGVVMRLRRDVVTVVPRVDHIQVDVPEAAKNFSFGLKAVRGEESEGTLLLDSLLYGKKVLKDFSLLEPFREGD